MNIRIDAHQHYWKPDRGDYGWLTPEQGHLYADFLPSHLKSHLQKHGIERTIVVQAAPTLEETAFMLSLYEQEESIVGVVGWLELDSDEFPLHYSNFRRHKGFVGFRPMLQDLPNGWILRPRVMDNLRLIAKDEFPIDLQLRPRHLTDMRKVLREIPSLRAVIDHAAKPFIADKIIEPWKEQIAELARYPGVMCKLSGLVTEADQQNWSWMDLVPYVHHVVETFGPGRIMFGSDWPVCLLTCDYDTVVVALQRSLPSHLRETDYDAIFGGNALRFYKIEAATPPDFLNR
ncbi:amidohydrolase [Paenibacillus sp. OV219]|uniref:amidohydrolase family protein n=1 Tax=Paenibacillus sp. OV219 TaxID=1884377 RepID=UPI0008C0E23E|nr:amidohydrolase family protein [Paenibacillus sp. OV219]SEN82051.1 L-fuconolactonase [Paenibacillus sp. OV219]